MAPKRKPEGELKDQRIPVMMSEAELKAIDDWSFENRIRSRGEAIRRLCQIGIVASINAETSRKDLSGVLKAWLDAVSAFRDRKEDTALTELETLSGALATYASLSMPQTLAIIALMSGKDLVSALEASGDVWQSSNDLIDKVLGETPDGEDGV